VATRKKYLKLIEKTRAAGGKTFVFSSLHTSGEQLGNLTGVAAILHYPMPDIEEEAVENE
jgi:protein pelota